MSTPDENPSGYNLSSPIWRVDSLGDKKFFLLHGTFDDNVHYQNAMMLSEELEKNNILFR